MEQLLEYFQASSTQNQCTFNAPSMNFNLDFQTLQLATQLNLLQQGHKHAFNDSSQQASMPSLGITLPGVSRKRKVEVQSPDDLIAHLTEEECANSISSLGNDSDADKIKKRRSQIAAASRKSRAKRKQELLSLRKENEKLWQDIRILRSKTVVSPVTVTPNLAKIKCESREELMHIIKSFLNEQLNKMKMQVSLQGETQEGVDSIIDSLTVSLCQSDAP